MSEPVDCPWCGSDKIMAEGTEQRMAMVCQKCLTRGPEVDVRDGRQSANAAWNNLAEKRRPIYSSVMTALEDVVDLCQTIKHGQNSAIIERAEQIIHAHKLIQKSHDRPQKTSS